MREEYKELSFYRHRVQITIEGFRTDKLLSTAFRKGIKLRNVRMISDTELIAWVSYRDCKTLRKLAKSLYRITVIKEAGPQTKVSKIRKEPLLIAGILLAASIVFFQSVFVAQIVVDGYKAIPEQCLRQCLNEAGIYEGVYLPSINWEKAKADIYATFPQVTWVKLVYDGTVVYLDIAETDDLRDSAAAEGDKNTDESGEKISYTDLVAEENGYIESVQPLWGEARVEPGDYVKKGQILIGGEIPIKPTTFEENDPDRYYVKASGQVWARVPYRLNFAQERYEEPAHLQEPQSSSSDKIIIANKQERTPEQIKAKADQQIRLWMKENLPENAEIINKSLNFSAKENIIEIGVTIEVRREITKEQETAVGQKISDKRGD